MENNPEIKKAKEELDKIKQDEIEEDRALRRLLFVMDQEAVKRTGYERGMQQGMQKGVQQGLQEGIQKEKIDIAKKLLSKHMSISDIAEITGLSKEEIEKLKD